MKTLIAFAAALILCNMALAATDEIQVNYTIPTERVNGDPLPVIDIDKYQFDFRKVGATAWDYGGTQNNSTKTSFSFDIVDAEPGQYEITARARTTDAAEDVTPGNPSGNGKWSVTSTFAVITIEPSEVPDSSPPNPPSDLTVVTVRITVVTP